MNQQSDQQAKGIGHDMALAPVDLLASIIAPDTAAFGGLHALAVDYAGTWAGLAPRKLPRHHNWLVVDTLQQSLVSPGVEVAFYRRAGWKVVGEQRPLAAAAQAEADAVKQLSRVGGLAAPGFGRVLLQDDRLDAFLKLVRHFPDPASPTFGRQPLLSPHIVPLGPR